jgi:hypothetical protein
MNLTGSLNAGYSSLNHSLKELRILWEETKSHWKDAVSESFEEHQWHPLEARMVGALRAMDRLAPVLNKMQQDCQ